MTRCSLRRRNVSPLHWAARRDQHVTQDAKFSGAAGLPVTIVLVAPAIWAQPPEALPEFDVASIKLYPHDDNGMIVRASASGIHLETTLRQLTRLAYQIQDFQLSTNGLAWLDLISTISTARLATVTEATEQTDQMPLTLLAKSSSSLRRESKEVPAYSLNIAKGIQIKASR